MPQLPNGVGELQAGRSAHSKTSCAVVKAKCGMPCWRPIRIPNKENCVLFAFLQQRRLRHTHRCVPSHLTMAAKAYQGIQELKAAETNAARIVAEARTGAGFVCIAERGGGARSRPGSATDLPGARRATAAAGEREGGGEGGAGGDEAAAAGRVRAAEARGAHHPALCCLPLCPSLTTSHTPRRDMPPLPDATVLRSAWGMDHRRQRLPRRQSRRLRRWVSSTAPTRRAWWSSCWGW